MYKIILWENSFKNFRSSHDYLQDLVNFLEGADKKNVSYKK